MTSSIRSLPLAAWASRFRSGQVVLHGRLGAAVSVGPVSIEPGMVRFRASFFGGPKPALNRADVDARLSYGGQTAHRLVVATDGLWLDGARVADAELPLTRAFEGLIDGLADVRLEAEATPAGELSLKFPAGVEVVVPGTDPLVVTGRTEGPPEELVLAGPLEVAIGGAGLRLSHRQLRWLANAVQVAVCSARLHPDGTVDLEGGARGGLNRLVQGGLDVAGEQLADLVRTAPQFEKVRSFLRE